MPWVQLEEAELDEAEEEALLAVLPHVSSITPVAPLGQVTVGLAPVESVEMVATVAPDAFFITMLKVSEVPVADMPVITIE